MTFTVIRSSEVVVQPSSSTPSGTLELSVMDRLPNLRMYVQTLHVFQHGREAAKVITEAMSKALVPYYPLAGRLKESSHDKLQIACTGEGIWFIEASTDQSLDSFNYFDNVHTVPQNELLPTSPPEALGLDPLVLIQLTSFECEGFVMGVKFCHSICDGLGAAQFLNAVGEFARGFRDPEVAPVWLREAIPAPVWFEKMQRELGESKLPPMPMPLYQLDYASIDIGLDQINSLKSAFKEFTGDYCSTFDVVAATLWRIRTQAINLEEDATVNLVFFANTRHFLNPPLPEGFYGNCFFPVTVTASSEWLAEASNAETVKLIRDAKARLPFELRKWLKSDEVDNIQDPFSAPLEYTTLYISEWGRLGFNQIDYGWGKPVHVLPIQGPSIMPLAIVGSPPTPKKGTRLMTWCVSSAHLSSLIDQTVNLN